DFGLNTSETEWEQVLDCWKLFSHHVNHLKFYKYKINERQLESFLCSCTSLVSLTVNCCDCADCDTDSLCDLINLANISDDDLLNLVGQPESFKQSVEELDLRGCDGVTDLGLTQLLPELERLLVLNLEEVAQALQENIEFDLFLKKIIRTRQATFLPSEFFEFFAQQLILHHKERKYFLFWLSQYLERFSRNLTCGVYIGLEHLMRELSQMYVLHALNESLSEKSSLATILKTSNENAELYVKHAMIDILFAGHPIELFDEDAQWIPDLFFANLMQGLQDRMGKKNRIGVISVLGVQSSGKSTLMNVMCGCKFIVSSGRCTKGVNMQLVTVQKQYAANFNVDYILVLDTEDLKSPERQDFMGNNEHDSELATFVVGLSDVVVLNVASESMDALKDIIQITIHAFLRMRDKLANERKLFGKTLKDLTDIAAKSEIGTTEVSFKDILDYDEDTSHEYFPCLYDEVNVSIGCGFISSAITASVAAEIQEHLEIPNHAVHGQETTKPDSQSNTVDHPNKE
ncbi:hypothetical protein QYM36_006832, partial [Artemia franciscana]